MAVLATVKHEWHRFKNDPPGRRFQNQRRRMRNGPRALMVAQVGLGVVLMAAGIVMLFAPGPGLLFIVFGLALIAGLSKPLARWLDRGEPKVRRGAHTVEDWWGALPIGAKLGLGAIAAMAVAAFAYVMYGLWFA